MDRLGDILLNKQTTPHSQTPGIPSPAPFVSNAPVQSLTVAHTPMEHEPPLPETLDLKTLVLTLKKDIDALLSYLEQHSDHSHTLEKENVNETEQSENKVIEGVFNGIKMIGDDGAEYPVPPNYASKSKLVEGDILKLTIQENGTFIYKQIAPTEREHVRGTLFYHAEQSQWNMVTSTGQSYKVLNASVTFYKGKSGSPVVALVPKNGPSEWAAVENILAL